MKTSTKNSSILPLSLEQQNRSRRSALKIALAYFLMAALWILASDLLLKQLIDSLADPALPPDLRTQLVLQRTEKLQILKGWAYVAATALILYWLIRAYVRASQQADNAMQAKLAETAADFRHLFENNPLPMLAYDPDSLAILQVNNSAIQKYGYSREEFLQITLADIRPSEDKLTLRKSVDAVKDLPASSHIARHSTKHGKTIDVEVTGHPIQINGRKARLVVINDITERIASQRALEQYRQELENRVTERTHDLTQANKQLQAEIDARMKIEEELRRAKLAADEANNAKTVFVANTTHELRTPLTSIIGYSELLEDPGLSPQRRADHLKIIQESARQLMTLIDELLDISRIEAGRILINLDHHDLREIFTSVVNQLRPRAAQKGLTLNFQIDEKTPATLYTDGARLRQVLLNLVANAVKFTQAGAVKITAAPGPSDSIEIAVTDTGIGIPPDHLAHIFEPFYQVQHGLTKHLGGTGLGLPISRQLVEKLGGSIRVNSTPARGSTFTVTLPTSRPAPRNPDSPSPDHRTLNVHVLLAEDDANVRWLVEEFLRRAGASVTPVASGHDALLAYAAAANAGSPPDLILLDISMPDVDGLQCAQMLRARGYDGPLVAMTAHSSPKEHQHYLAQGFTSVLTKPLDTKTFIPALAKLIPQNQPA